MTTKDDDISMGTRVPYPICDKCTGEEPPTSEVTECRFDGISLCTFTDKDLQGVADHLSVPVADIEAYLSGPDRVTKIDQAFHFITGMYPIRPTPPHL